MRSPQGDTVLPPTPATASPGRQTPRQTDVTLSDWLSSWRPGASEARPRPKPRLPLAQPREPKVHKLPERLRGGPTEALANRGATEAHAYTA